MLFGDNTTSNYCEMQIDLQFSVAKCKSKACNFPFGDARFGQLVENAQVTIDEAVNKRIHRYDEGEANSLSRRNWQLYFLFICGNNPFTSMA